MIAAMIEVISTAPAAVSLMSRMEGSISFVSRSHHRSMALLKVSAPSTMPMHKSTRHHSILDSFNQSPMAITINEMTSSI